MARNPVQTLCHQHPLDRQCLQDVDAHPTHRCHYLTHRHHHPTHRECFQDVSAHSAARAAPEGVQQQEALQGVTVLHSTPDLVQDLEE